MIESPDYIMESPNAQEPKYRRGTQKKRSTRLVNKNKKMWTTCQIRVVHVIFASDIYVSIVN